MRGGFNHLVEKSKIRKQTRGHTELNGKRWLIGMIIIYSAFGLLIWILSYYKWVN